MSYDRAKKREEDIDQVREAALQAKPQLQHFKKFSMTKRSSGSFFCVHVYLSHAYPCDIGKKEKVQNNMQFSTTSTLTRAPTLKVKKTAAPSECTLFNLDINVNGLIFI